ncbi:MAG: BlaI/MecI/CopY family transcriptional regulator [Defluviitaleaceae bacterium]|nr:BlaI/MecI/CopY family transcriptional regulator [Defluviitaleaceae bacterium]
MKTGLYDSELKVMGVLWKEGDTTAKDIAAILNQKLGWSKTTTYTIIKKCIDKELIQRRDPNFVCRALVTRKQAQEYEAMELVDKMFDGSSDMLVASLINGKRLTRDQLGRLRNLINSVASI